MMMEVQYYAKLVFNNVLNVLLILYVRLVILLFIELCMSLHAFVRMVIIQFLI